MGGRVRPSAIDSTRGENRSRGRARDPRLRLRLSNPGVSWFPVGLLGVIVALGGWAAPGRAADQADQAGRPPNVVFFLVDDLGYMDIGANNRDTFYETPHVDRLAREGMRFTSAYAANPVCSPTRYSIMTGKYPSRVGATNFFSGTRAGRFLPAPLNDRMPLVA